MRGSTSGKYRERVKGCDVSVLRHTHKRHEGERRRYRKEEGGRYRVEEAISSAVLYGLYDEGGTIVDVCRVRKGRELTSPMVHFTERGFTCPSVIK